MLSINQFPRLVSEFSSCFEGLMGRKTAALNQTAALRALKQTAALRALHQTTGQTAGEK